jgi:hypothetical protein
VVETLCVADRHFLMRELARHLGAEAGWFSATCGACGSRFDFELAYGDLPVKPAGTGFPLAEVEVEGQTFTLRLPTGRDQADLLSVPSDERLAYLIRQLVVSPTVDPSWPGEVDPGTLERIEEALEDISPAVLLEVTGPCPECGKNNRVSLEPYEALDQSGGGLMEEVHRIAWHYHWSEQDILSLPQNRRMRYLRLIDASRGMVD